MNFLPVSYVASFKYDKLESCNDVSGPESFTGGGVHLPRGQCACRPTALVQMNATRDSLKSWMVYHSTLIYPPVTNSNGTCPVGRTCLDETPLEHTQPSDWGQWETEMGALQTGRPYYGSITGLAPGPGFVHACGQRVEGGEWYYMRIHIDADTPQGSVGVAIIQVLC